MINLDASALEAKFANRTGGAAQPVPIQDLSRLGTQPPQGGQMQDIPEGVVLQQTVGRGQPAIMVVPPQDGVPSGPQIAVVPPQHTGRTTIGTFVDIPSRQETPVQLADKQTPDVTSEAESPKKRKPVDLVQLMLDHIHELGGEKGEAAQDFYDRSQASLTQWIRNPANIPLGAVVKFLQRKPGVRAQIAEDLEPHFSANGEENFAQSLPNRGKPSVLVCSPVLERPTLPFLWTLLYLAKKYEIGFDVQADTMIVRSRNMLAHRFLDSGATWSLWIDGDMACPIGNRDWFRWVTRSQSVPDEFTAYDTLARLLGHSKAMVGGVYAARSVLGRLVIQPEINPRHHEDKLLCNEIRRGTAKGLAAVEWIGFGCALVHRAVFLEIQQRFPQLAPKTGIDPWHFFDPVGSEGEDEAFCLRARACEIPIWLDTQLICGHVGSQVFLPEHTASIMAV